MHAPSWPCFFHCHSALSNKYSGALHAVSNMILCTALAKQAEHGWCNVSYAGKMVPFAGWSMPIQYKDSLVEATLHCRSNASLFDVSHMCGLTLKARPYTCHLCSG